MFPEAINGIFGNFGKRIVGPIEDWVLAEHGHSDCRCGAPRNQSYNGRKIGGTDCYHAVNGGFCGGVDGRV